MEERIHLREDGECRAAFVSSGQIAAIKLLVGQPRSLSRGSSVQTNIPQMAVLTCDRMRCASFVGKGEQQLWRSLGADTPEFALIRSANRCRANIETHLSRSLLARVIPERLMLVLAAPAVAR
jgi:hypothetical protein